jgi:nucleotide-binding universal stress UspA family protein
MEAAMNPWLVLAALVVLAAVAVVLPVVAAAWSDYRRHRRLRCPIERVDARVRLDAGRAAVSDVLGRPALAVAGCSLWPRRRGCGQTCLTLPAAEVHRAGAGAPAPGGPLRTILVPLDESPGSESVLWTVGQLARAQRARVHLLRVASTPKAVQDDDRMLAFADQEDDRIQRSVVFSLKSIAERLDGVTVDASVRFGDPAAEIVDQAESLGVDLIAMAARRRTGLAGLFRRGVAERVERATTVPLVLVPYGE